MVASLQEKGDAEVLKIQKSCEEEVSSTKTSYIEEERNKIIENFKNELANEEVKLKIEKSKSQNMERIKKMRAVNEYLEKIKDQTKAQVREDMKKDPNAYKELLKGLLIQVCEFIQVMLIIVYYFLGFNKVNGRTYLVEMQRRR